jgi:spore coat protein A, manganese oxidase
VLVNGAPWPRMEVGRRKYRFRILNACNAQIMTLGLSSERPFTQIGTDGGLMQAPVKVGIIPLAEAERVEVVIDFAEYSIGTQVVLQDLNESIGGQRDMMRFDVVRNVRDDSAVPNRLREVEPLPESVAVRIREFRFNAHMDLGSFPPAAMTINGQPFDPERVDANPRLGDVEIWQFRGGEKHAAHVHLVQFQVLDRGGQKPAPHECGWKDTVQLGDEVRVTRASTATRASTSSTVTTWSTRTTT